MHSALYVGRVRHTRYQPRRHGFRYRLFQFYLDLDELPGLLRRLPLCSATRPALVRFRRADHLGDPAQSLKETVRQKVRELGGPGFDGAVRLLTNLRYFGYGFNPVSFYYCFDADERLRCVLAEVNNTPWGERHCYLVPVHPNERGMIRHASPKEFHVSPFMGLDMGYRWTLTEPAERVTVHIRNIQHERLLFDAALSMKRESLTTGSVLRNLVRFPFVTAKVVVAIYFEALRLWLKRVPYQPHSRSGEAPSAAK